MSIIVEIPEAFSTAYKLGKVVRYGTVLKDVNTGKIVAHLAESKNLIDLISKIPTNKVQMVTGLVNAASSVAANHQLYNQSIQLTEQGIQLAEQGKKLSQLVEQVTSLSGLTKIAVGLSGVGAIASVATFALCATKFKAIDNRLNNIETKVDAVLDRLELQERNTEKREVRTYLCEIKSSFDYLIPTASRSKVEEIQRDLSRGFSGINIYLKDKIQSSPKQVDIDDVIFLYNTLTITAMGEFRGFVILNDVQGAKHILHKRKTDLNDLKKSLAHISQVIKADDNKLDNEQLKDKKDQFELLVNNVMACYADFDSQGLIVSEYLDKKKIQLKHYYEDMENDDTQNGIIVVPH
jgi:Holliday junction resolvasome RuvABC endonuclease subunit